MEFDVTDLLDSLFGGVVSVPMVAIDDPAELPDTPVDPSSADQFVEMYVNDWTLDFGPIGRQAVARLLDEGYQAGVIPNRVVPEFVD